MTASQTCSVTSSTTSVFKPTSSCLGAPPVKLLVPSNQFCTPVIPSAHHPDISTSTEPSQCATTTSLCSSRVPSTAITDKLANLDVVIAQLINKVNWLMLQSRESVKFKPRIEELTQANQMLQATVEDHHAVIYELEANIDAQSASLE